MDKPDDSQKPAEAVGKGIEAVGEVADKVGQLAHCRRSGCQGCERCEDTLSGSMSRNPWFTLGVGVGAGVLIGRYLAKRRRRC